MAKRRMFSPDITETDIFTDMRLSAQALYFHLGLHADDDGFVGSPKQTARGIGATTKDLNMLVENGFVIPFSDGVVVITHWRAQNAIRADRYTPTIYQDYFNQIELTEGNVYKPTTERQPDGNQLLPQVDSKFKKVNKEDNTLSLEREFESIWTLYPKRQGRKKALEAYCRARKTGTSYEVIKDGVETYANYVRREKKEDRFIKHGSTFFNQSCWQDDYTVTRDPGGGDYSELEGIL